MICDNNRNKNTEKGKIKGTSAFDIKAAKSENEISWSNNKFESTYNISNNQKEE